MDIFNSKKKKLAVLELEELQVRYNSIGREANGGITNSFPIFIPWSPSDRNTLNEWSEEQQPCPFAYL